MKYEIPQLEIEAFSHTPLPKIAKSKKKKPRHTKNKKIKTAKRKED
jgi:hypothetical protein